MNIFEVVFSNFDINITDDNKIIFPEAYITENSSISAHSILSHFSTSTEIYIRKEFNKTGWLLLFESNGVIYFPRKPDLVSFTAPSTELNCMN